MHDQGDSVSRRRSSSWAIAAEVGALALLIAASSFLSVAVLEATGGLKGEIVAAEIKLEEGRVLKAQSEEEYDRLREEHRGQIKGVKVEYGTDYTVQARIVEWSSVAAFGTVLSYLLIRERKRLGSWLAPDPRAMLLGVLGGLLFVGIGAVHGKLLDIVGLHPRIETIEMIWGLLAQSAGGILVMVVLAPIVEEIYFRGRLYDWLFAKWGVRRAVMVSAAAFAVAHLIPWLLPVYWLYGAILATLRQRTRGLLAPMLAHAINNGAAVFLLSQQP